MSTKINSIYQSDDEKHQCQQSEIDQSLMVSNNDQISQATEQSNKSINQSQSNQQANDNSCTTITKSQTLSRPEHNNRLQTRSKSRHNKQYLKLSQLQQNGQKHAYNSQFMSISISIQASIDHSSKLSYSKDYLNLADIAKLQLQSYQDIIEDQFVLIQTNQEQRDKNNLAQESGSQYSSYMNWHMTEVPIGNNHQASIPKICSSLKYIQQNLTKLQNISKRKIHEPIVDQMFYNENCDYIQQKLGLSLTYIDINEIRINCSKKSMYTDVQKYLGQDQIVSFWQGHFTQKNKKISKVSTKKKRKKFK